MESFVLVLFVVLVAVLEGGILADGGHAPGIRLGGKTENRLCCCCEVLMPKSEATSAAPLWPRFVAELGGKAGEADCKLVAGALTSSSLGFLGLLPSCGGPVELEPLWYLLAI